jgi:hypothetical protein
MNALLQIWSYCTSPKCWDRTYWDFACYEGESPIYTCSQCGERAKYSNGVLTKTTRRVTITI